MNEVTRIPSAIEAGDARAADELLPLVYEELRKLAANRMAREAPGQTLQATALVHEAYVRLVGQGSEQQWHSRGHFFAAAAEAMRRILVERARHKRSLKAGGARQRQDLALLSADVVPGTSGRCSLARHPPCSILQGNADHVPNTWSSREVSTAPCKNSCVARVCTCWERKLPPKHRPIGARQAYALVRLSAQDTDLANCAVWQKLLV